MSNKKSNGKVQGVLVLDNRHWHITDRAHPKFATHVFRISMAMKNPSADHLIAAVNEISGLKMIGTELHPKLLSKHRNFINSEDCEYKYEIDNARGLMSIQKKYHDKERGELHWREQTNPLF